jgi:hypothetical protein
MIKHANELILDLLSGCNKAIIPVIQNVSIRLEINFYE